MGNSSGGGAVLFPMIIQESKSPEMMGLWGWQGELSKYLASKTFKTASFWDKNIPTLYKAYQVMAAEGWGPYKLLDAANGKYLAEMVKRTGLDSVPVFQFLSGFEAAAKSGVIPSSVYSIQVVNQYNKEVSPVTKIGQQIKSTVIIAALGITGLLIATGFIREKVKI